MKTLQPIMVLALLAGAVAPIRAAETDAVPYKAAPGPLAVETVNEIVLHDAKRDKDLPVFVSYSKGDGKFPVIIFSYGAMGSGDMGFPIVRHWTSHGYVVLCPTHADSIKLRRAQGRDGAGDTLTLIRGSGRGGGWDDNWTQRPRDVSFVLDSLDVLEEKVPGLKGRLDRDRLAVAGHSLGAYTAQVAGGATVAMPGKDQPQSLADPRLKAILQLSGQGTDQQGLHKDSWKDIRIPMMCVTGSLDRAAQGQEPFWRREPFALSAPGDKYFLFVEGAHHGSFTGKVAEGGLSGVERLGQLTPEQRSRLRARLAGGQPSAEDATKPADPSAAGAGTPAPRPAGRLGGRLAGADAAGNQKAIFDWVRQATTAFWDASLKNDTQAKKFLESDALAKLSDGKAKLER
jgi:predicted dienelactone hydrolase